MDSHTTQQGNTTNGTKSGSTKNVWEYSFFLPFISAFSIAGVYYYEAGYFTAMGIPLVYVEVELINNVALLFSYLATVLFISLPAFVVYSRFATSLYGSFANPKNNRVKAVIGIAMILTAGFFLTHVNENEATEDLKIILGVSLLLLCFLSLWNSQPLLSRTYESFLQKGLVSLIAISLTCLLMAELGRRQAHRTYYAESNVITLRAYSDQVIKGLQDSALAISRIVVIRNNSVDTIPVLSQYQ